MWTLQEIDLLAADEEEAGGVLEDVHKGAVDFLIACPMLFLREYT